MRSWRELFLSPAYRDGTHKRPSDYWVPLLSLFSGARQGELCQLYVGDVRREGEVWALDINEQGDKRLKTESSARLVPMHPQLVALGWLDYVESCRAKGQQRLFPGERRSVKGEFAAFSKRFARYREASGVTGTGKTQKDFHSLRHSFQHVLYGLGVEKYVVQDITGHSNAGEGEGLRTYAPGPHLATMYETICKLCYDLDFSHIKPNGWGASANA